MRKETYLKLKSQKRKAKLLAIFTALSLFGSATKESKANATTNTGSIIFVGNKEYDVSGITDEIIKYAKRGHTDGPQAYETWYPLPMNNVIDNMETKYGYTDLVYEIRNDGVKILSGTAPDGTKFEDLVMVAADVWAVDNPNGTFERGEFVETTLGKGIVVDFCEEAMIKRKYNNGIQFDIATAWHTQPYESIIYGKKNKAKTKEKELQTNTKKANNEEIQINDKIALPPGIVFDPERYISASDLAKSK